MLGSGSPSYVPCRCDEWSRHSHTGGLERDAQHSDINVARIIGLGEQRINSTILIGNGNEVRCRAASFTVPLRIDGDAFDIDAYLLDIDNDVDVILGMPWLVSPGSITWNFTDMEL